MLVREAIENYLDECKQLQPKTQKWYTQKLHVFSAWCEQTGVGLEKINNRAVIQFTEYLSTTRSPRKASTMSSYTISGYVQVVKGFVSWCTNDEEYEEYVRDKTARRIKKPTVDQVIIDVFTQEQIDRIYKACENEYNPYLIERDKAIIDVLLTTGIRSGELCGLTIGNVVLSPAEDAHIKVFGKRRKWREVGLEKQTRRSLQKFIRRYRAGAGNDELVFLSRMGEALTPNGMSQIFQRLRDWAGGMKGVRCSPHTFRHTFAVRFLQNGGDIFILSRLLGHGSITITQNYLKAFNQRDARMRQIRGR